MGKKGSVMKMKVISTQSNPMLMWTFYLGFLLKHGSVANGHGHG